MSGVTNLNFGKTMNNLQNFSWSGTLTGDKIVTNEIDILVEGTCPTPTSGNEIANKDYVDDNIPVVTGFLKVDGTNSMAANLNAGTNKVINVSNGTNAADGVNVSQIAGIAANATAIAANTAAIASQAGLITANTAAITANDTDIANNLAKINANIGDIALLQVDVANNTTAITANDVDIAANTAAITANDVDIAANSTAISTNTATLATQAGLIAANTAAITSNDTDIAANTAAITAIQGDYFKKTGTVAATGAFDMATNKITGLGNAVADTDAVNKQFANGLIMETALLVDGTNSMGANLNLNNHAITNGTDATFSGNIKADTAFIGEIYSNNYAGFSYSTMNTINNYAILQDSTGHTFVNAPLNKTIAFRINNNTKMFMNSDGNIDFGSGALYDIQDTFTGPNFRCNFLRGMSGSSLSLCRSAKPNNSSGVLHLGNAGHHIDCYRGDTGAGRSLYLNYYSGQPLYMAGGVLITSDRRIKENFEEIKDDEALQKLRLLNPVTYTYKTTPDHERVYGFIAQEVKEVLPNAVSTEQLCIPNIVARSKVEITDDGGKITILDSSESTDTLVEGRKAQIRYLCCGSKADVIVKKIINSKSFEFNYGEELADLNVELLSGTDTDGNPYTNELILLGTEVDDFHILSKTTIWTVCCAALQEVDRQLQAEKVKTTTLEERLSLLENEVNKLKNG